MSLPNSDFDKALNISRLAIVSIGLIGNVLSFIVFSRKTFRNNSISTYCRALAVFDCITIIQLIKDVVSMINYMDFFENWNDASCKIFFYLSMEYTALPGWILVAFSVDKMLNMRTSAPNILKSKLFQWSVVGGILLVHLLLFIVLLIDLKLEPFIFFPGVKFCNFNFLSYLNAFMMAQITETCILPFAIMIVTSIVTIRLLMRSRMSLERIGNADKHRRKRDIRFAISSISFNVFFISFKMPFLLYYVLPSNLVDYTFFQLAFLFFLINCSSSFFLHLATNSIFRRELFIILHLKIASNRVSSLFQTSRHIVEVNQRTYS